MLIILNIVAPPPAAMQARAAAAYCGCRTDELPHPCFGTGKRRRWRRVRLDDWLASKSINVRHDWKKAATR